MTSPRRVVVTGMGVVSALGTGYAEHSAGLKAGQCGIGPIQRFDTERLMVKIAGEAARFEGSEHFGRSELSMLDRVSQMALVASDEAFASSGLEVDDALALRTATILGSAMGGLNTLDEAYFTSYHDMKNRVHPFVVPRLMSNAPVSQISMKHGLMGPAYVVSTACSSANHAMGQAFQMVRSGTVDAAVTGGAEAMLCFGGIKAWEGLRVMSKEACRPFSRNRNGMVIGEGSAVLIFEELDRAKARGANILAEVSGFGMTADAGDIVQPSQQGASRAMRQALQDAGMDASEVGYINAHGTATAMNDRVEAATIRSVLEDQAEKVMVSSTKSMHGHAIGAAGALEAVATVMALSEGVIPPTIGHEEEDPDVAPLDIVPNVARETSIDAALSNSFAFGGLNAVLAMRRWTGA
ncbi:MAG: beta-ketoacyl-[acyl-carrier-protein] synthase family protein [Pseudomonadota bacterium]